MLLMISAKFDFYISLHSRFTVISEALNYSTQAVRGGTWRSEHGETSEALFLTSGYTYDDAETVAARFAGEQQGMTYSRLQNPTVAMVEERIALMEGAEACRMQATGMAAMTTALLCQLSQGDHVVAARAAFGSCRWLWPACICWKVVRRSSIARLPLNNWPMRCPGPLMQ